MKQHIPRIIAASILQAAIVVCMYLDNVFMVLMLCIYGMLALFYLLGVVANNTFDLRKWGSIHGGW